ncbi:MAG TPA: hypothetical protein VJX67_21430, partial [Blastocatellia bacterium]|nr:hypothetical protein [Blastocatellia bacterium]
IAQQLKVDDRPSVPDIEDLIVAKLKQLPRPLFIDQANYLSDKMLGTCCKIWNETKVPVVLLGTKDLYDLFTSTRLTEDTRTQISTRISMYYQLQGLTLEELKTIVTDRLPPEAATDEVIAELQKLSFTVHRTLDNLLGNMLRIAKANEGKKLDWKQVAIKAAGRLIIV